MKKSNTSGILQGILQTKVLLLMKLTAFFFFISTFTLIASVSFSQNKTVTINRENTLIKDVLQEIEDQSGYFFIYNNEFVDVYQKINIHAKDKSVQDVLNVIFREQDITYTINDRRIILSSSGKPYVAQQQRTLSGRVTDSSGNPLPGVTVVIRGTSVGTITSSNGNYSLTDVPANAILVFSFVGMKSQEVTVGNQSSVNIAMAEESIGIDEIVAVGYGTQKKVNLTGSISSVDTEELTSITTSDLRTSMAGKLPGLRIMQRSGEPGSYDSFMDIRGYGGSPLVIVDGIPRSDFQKIDPNTIANISILKDASAAVYGVRASDGVILVETKQGQKGSAEISFTSIYSIQKITEFPEPIDNSIESLVLKNEAALAAGNPIPYPDYLEYDGSDPLKPNINYWDLTMKKWAPQTQNSLTVSGGTDDIKYFISLGYLYDMGLLKSDNLKYERYNIKSNITAKVAKNVTAQLIISGLTDKKKSPYGSTSYDFFKQLWMQPPYEPVYYWDPALNAYDVTKYYDGQADRNPLAVISPDVSGYRSNANKRVEVTASLAYDVPFIKGLSLKGMLAYDALMNTQKQWRIGYKEYKANGSFVQPQGTTRLIHRYEEWITPHLQFSATYQRSFGDHNFGGLFVFEQRKGNGKWFEAGRYFALDILDQLSSGNTKDQIANGRERVPGAEALTSGGLDPANRAFVGRINYDFKSKYLIELSGRYDGSSNFAEDGRWGFFPGVSVGWRLSEEPFLKDRFAFLDNLKVRASRGKMGDHSAATGFQFLEGYNYPEGGYLFSGDTWTTGSEYRGIVNPDITWYTATTTNVAVDFSLWKNLLAGSVDLFQRKREDLLARRAIQIPSTFGTSLPLENLESDQTRGFEIELSHINRIGEVRYQTKMMLSYTRSKWLHREATIAGNDYANWRNRDENRWKNLRWGYGYLGQFQTQEEVDNYAIVQLNNGHDMMYPGDIKYEDWNEDGMIDSHDEHPIGRGADPELFFSLNLGVEWRGLAVTAFFQGAARSDMMTQEQLLGPLPWGRNSSEMFLDRWHHEDPLDFDSPWVPGKHPISRDGFGYEPNKKTSPFWLHDGAYVRLKNLEVSYTLPARWTSSLDLKQVRLFANGLNLYTWSKAKEYSDPERPLEQEYGYKYPLMANYSFGVNIIF